MGLSGMRALHKDSYRTSSAPNPALHVRHARHARHALSLPALLTLGSASCLQNEAAVDAAQPTGSVVRMVQLGNNADESHVFHFDRPTRVHIIALGEDKALPPDDATAWGMTVIAVGPAH